MKIIAIDIAKFHHCASVTDDCTGEVLVNPFYFDNNADGYRKFYSIIKKYCNTKHLVGLEATGHYGDNLVNFLLDKKCTVALINPIVTKNEAKKNIRKTKTDKIDTFVILESKILIDIKINFKNKSILFFLSIIKSLKLNILNLIWPF